MLYQLCILLQNYFGEKENNIINCLSLLEYYFMTFFNFIYSYNVILMLTQHSYKKIKWWSFCNGQLINLLTFKKMYEKL